MFLAYDYGSLMYILNNAQNDIKKIGGNYEQEISKKTCVSILITLTLLITLVGCSNNDGGSKDEATSTNETTTADYNTTAEATEAPTQEAEAEPEIEKPDKITIMVDKTLLDEASGQKEFAAKFKEITGVELDIIQPDHNTYYDQVALAFTSGYCTRCYNFRICTIYSLCNPRSIMGYDKRLGKPLIQKLLEELMNPM